MCKFFRLPPSKILSLNLSEEEISFLDIHSAKDQAAIYDFSEKMIERLCWFINPEAAKKVFKETQSTTNAGFAADLKQSGIEINQEILDKMLETSNGRS